MTLILLAVSLTIVLCIIAYNLAIYALPFMVGLSAAQYAWGAGAGIFMTGLAAVGAALVSIALVIGVLGFAKNPALRLISHSRSLRFLPPLPAMPSFMASRRTRSIRRSRSIFSVERAACSSASPRWST